jgi:SAM-dependent methyltransferase
MGVVAHAVDKEQDEKWLHRPIAASASYCLGVDILKDEVEQLKQQGYNVRHCNILDSATDLGERFDVMIVGEVIEHLGSPEKLFEAAQRVLVPGGKLVMTTPNPYYWKRMRDSLRVKIPRCESADHVTYLYPSGIAEFAERAGMSLDAFRGVYTYRSSKLLGRIGLWLKQLVGGRLLARETFCNTMIYECTFRSEVAALRRAG